MISIPLSGVMGLRLAFSGQSPIAHMHPNHFNPVIRGDGAAPNAYALTYAMTVVFQSRYPG